MKSYKLIFLSLLSILILISSITSSLRKNNGRDVVTTSSSSSGPPPEPTMEKPDVGEIWSDLFTVPRTDTCRAEINRQNILTIVQAENERKFNGGEADMIVNDSAFGWIKKWGFGPVAYLLDFFDPLFRGDIIKEFQELVKDVMHEDPESTPEYSDIFDFAGRIATAPPERQDALMRDLKKFEKTYDPIVFQNSANSVQIMKSMKAFKWFVDPGMADYAADFVTRYDINHDGRLNPKELTLGAIHYNKNILGSKKCTHCFSTVSRRLGALFSYLDCGDTGFINADIMIKLTAIKKTNSSVLYIWLWK